MAISATAKPTKTTFILEASQFNSKQGRLVKRRVELNESDTIKDSLIKIGALQFEISGECSLIFVHSFE